MSCTRTGHVSIKDLDGSATRRRAPGNTETNDASANDGDPWFANTQEAVNQEAALFTGMTQTGSTGVISAATIAAPLAVCKMMGIFAPVYKRFTAHAESSVGADLHTWRAMRAE